MEGATELNLFLFFVDWNIAYGSSLQPWKCCRTWEHFPVFISMRENINLKQPKKQVDYDIVLGIITWTTKTFNSFINLTPIFLII